MRSSAHLLGLLGSSLFLTMTIQGQSFNTTVGGDQTYNAIGLQTDFKWHTLSGWTGLGYSDGLKVGAYALIPFHHDNYLGVGDQTLPGYLDVDEYDTHTFTVRGVNLIRKINEPAIPKIRKGRNGSVQLFTGFLSEEENYPFLHLSATSGSNLTETPIAALLYQRRISETLQMHSITMYSAGEYTSIGSVGWRPSRNWGLAGAGGVGANSHYLAGKGEFSFDKAEGWASYTVAGKDFHREETPFYSSDSLGFNGKLTLKPASSVKLILDSERNRVFIPSLLSITDSENTASTYASVKGTQLGSSVGFVSTSNLPGHTLSEISSVSRQILPRWRAFGAFIYMKSPTFDQKTFVTTNEFRVSPRLSTRQNYNRMNGQDNLTFGGQWMSNLISLSVDNQVYMSPLAPALGGKSVFQAWTFNIRFRTPHGTNTHLNTFVTQQGQIMWGGYLGGLRYDAVGPTASGSPSFSKYVIQGKVIDTNGRGVWGIAINIGNETVVSDTDGSFFTHVKNTKPFPFIVAADISPQTARWSIASAPASAYGVPEDAPTDIRVVVQMASALRASK